MTDSTDKKNPPKRGGRLDADLDAMLDDAQSSLAAPEDSVDQEDAIDRLLAKDPFDLGMEPESLFGKDGKADANEMSLEDRFARFGEIGDEFDITGFDDDITLDADEFADEDEDEAVPAESLTTDVEPELPDDPGITAEDPAAVSEPEMLAEPEQPAEIDEFSEFDEFGDDFFDQLVSDEFAEAAVKQPEPAEAMDDSEIELADQDSMQDGEATEFAEIAEEDEFAEEIMAEEATEADTDDFLPDFDISTFDGVEISDDTELPEGLAGFENETGDLGDDIAFSEDPQDGIKELLQPDESYTAALGQPQSLDYDDIAEKLGIPGLSQFSADQDSINSKQKKQILELEAKAKKTATFGIAGLAVGAVALITGIVVAVLGHGTHSEVQKMTESVAAIQTQKAAEAASPPATQADLAVLEQQFNAKVNDLVQQAAGNTMTQEEATAVPPVAENKHAPEDHRHQAADKADEHAVTPMDMAKKEPKPHAQPEAPAKPEKAKTEPAPAPAPAPAPTVVAEKPKPVKKPEAPKAKTAAVTAKSTKATASPPLPAGKASVPTAAASGWSVNLVAVKQQWYAQSKAAEFERKGVPVEVIPVEVNNQTWYRLRVRGFKDRQEANEYAARVKKALNLSSVWVGN
ncbi:MAG: hypothetical protein CTY34_03695 [Methylobacter sp.]|nr:MAG: hypothetical protein CTY34_03695 [Methylobacter sp.]